MTFAAGLAAQGHRPFCAIYSTFLQRAYDQVVHDVAIQNLPVRFAMDRAGLVGADGCTHAGSFDLAYLCTLPNFVVMAAADEVELTHMVHTMALHDSGPSAVRYPRGNGRGLAIPAVPERLEIGKGRIVREGKTVAILSLGTRLEEAEKAAAMLEAKGLSTTVADMRFAKPLDEELIRRLLSTHEVAVTIEEAAVGGFGAHVLTLASDEGLTDAGLKIRTMRLPDVFQDQEAPMKQYDEAGLNAPHIVETVLKALAPQRYSRRQPPMRGRSPEPGSMGGGRRSRHIRLLLRNHAACPRAATSRWRASGARIGEGEFVTMMAFAGVSGTTARFLWKELGAFYHAPLQPLADRPARKPDRRSTGPRSRASSCASGPRCAATTAAPRPVRLAPDPDRRRTRPPLRPPRRLVGARDGMTKLRADLAAGGAGPGRKPDAGAGADPGGQCLRRRPARRQGGRPDRRGRGADASRAATIRGCRAAGSSWRTGSSISGST